MNIKEVRESRILKRYHPFNGSSIEYSIQSYHTAFRQITPIKNPPTWLVMGSYYEITTHYVLN
jgi:hypothetical protein